ncbi:hypothetical protein [Cytobacillus gottheilii]|nr:hypothetical protein [Cytobacillus gottheilii]
MNLLFYLLNLIQEEFDKMDSRPLFSELSARPKSMKFIKMDR